MTIAKNSAQETTDLRAIDPDQLSRWKKIFRAYLGTKKCEKGLDPKPELKVDLLRTLQKSNGAETKKSQAYRDLIKKRVKAWKVKDRKAYGYLVKACETNESAMEVVLDEDNDKLSAKELLEALDNRFYQGEIVGVVQAKLAAFNSMEIDSKETAEDFINRLLSARRELIELGCFYIDKDVFCLGRLKDSLAKDQRFQQIALSMKANPQILWEGAVRLLTSMEATTIKGEEKKGSSTVVESSTDIVRKLKAQVSNFKGRLKNLQGKNNNADKKKNIKCFKCGKLGHYQSECKSGGKSSGGASKCDHCGHSGHTIAECRKRKREQEGDSKSGKSHHFDDDFDNHSSRLRMLQEVCSGAHGAAGGGYTAEAVMAARSTGTIMLDSGATSHMVVQSVADAVEDADLRPEQREVLTAKAGTSFVATARGRLGAMNNVLVASDSVLTDSVASVPQLDREGHFVLCGGGQAVLFNADLEPIAKAPLGSDNTYRFQVADLTREEKSLMAADTEEQEQRS